MPGKKPKTTKGGRGVAGMREAREKRMMGGREIVTRYGKGPHNPTISKLKVKKPAKRKR